MKYNLSDYEPSEYDLPATANGLPDGWWGRLFAWFAGQPGAPSAIEVDYRDRISVATWLIIFGLGLSVLYTMPTMVITFHALGSPISLTLTETLVAAILLAVLAATGTESIIRVHPRFVASPRRLIRRTWPFWTLPMALV